MSCEFHRDLQRCQADLAAARNDLLDTVRALSDSDLERARRGGWSVRRVLEHVIQSEWLYGRLVTHLRGRPVGGELPASTPASPAEALAKLEASRAALLEELEGVDEATFYELRTVGHEEYSILSLLENVALHDREHGPQVRDILAAS